MVRALGPSQALPATGRVLMQIRADLRFCGASVGFLKGLHRFNRVS